MAVYYQPPYAQPAYRAAAWMLDALIFVVLSLIPIVILYGAGLEAELIGVEMAMQAGYYILPTAVFQATPAKRILNMRVVMQDGSRLQPDAAILRYLVFLLTTFVPLGIAISAVMMYFDPERRSLHDRVAKTVVVSG